MPVPEPDLPVHRPDKLAVLVHVLSADGVQPAELLRGSWLTEAAVQCAQTRLTARPTETTFGGSRLFTNP